MSHCTNFYCIEIVMKIFSLWSYRETTKYFKMENFIRKYFLSFVNLVWIFLFFLCFCVCVFASFCYIYIWKGKVSNNKVCVQNNILFDGLKGFNFWGKKKFFFVDYKVIQTILPEVIKYITWFRRMLSYHIISMNCTWRNRFLFQ